MLVIRMQRTGRKGHAMFRVVVQDSRRTPTSGKVVAHLGSYDPHQKTVILDKEKVQTYLNNGAQPSERVSSLLKAQGVKLPKWVSDPTTKQRATKNADKRRSTRPPEPVAEVAPAIAEPEAEAASEKAQEVVEATAEVTEASEAPEAEAPSEPAPEVPSETA